MKNNLRNSIRVLLLSSAAYIAPGLAATTTPNTIAEALGGSGITSEALGGSGISSQALGGSGITTEALGGSGIYSEALGGSGISSQALGGSGITTEALGGSGVAAEALGGSGIRNSENRARNKDRRQILLMGPVEYADDQNKIIVVLGQQIQLTPMMYRIATEKAAEGASIELVARKNPSGLSGVKLKEASAYYVAGSDPVSVSGVATWHSRDLGRIQIGDAIIDVTNLLASMSPESIIAGELRFTGIQPISSGMIIAFQAE